MATRERPGNYEEQARSYDLTRGASPTLVRLIGRMLGPAEGRSLLDVAGGTGNYAEAMAARGFDVLVVDIESAMLARSVPKVGPGRQILGDAARLPLVEGSVDCAMMVQALHLVTRRTEALEEVRRVIGQGAGPFVLQAYTQENLRPSFVFEYFPGSDLPAAEHPPEAEIREWLSGARFRRIEIERYVYLDTADGNLQALHTDATRLAGPAYLRNTSFYQRLPEDVRREGLARLAEDLRSGVLQEKVEQAFQSAVSAGHGTIFAAWP
jgi:ubiquinone/menaquinone biosynthesis C-methylase UbiE